MRAPPIPRCLRTRLHGCRRERNTRAGKESLRVSSRIRSSGSVFASFVSAGLSGGETSAHPHRNCAGPSIRWVRCCRSAQRIFGKLTDCKVLVLGAGETSERTARALVSRGVRDIRVSNRSADRANELAPAGGGCAGGPFNE